MKNKAITKMFGWLVFAAYLLLTLYFLFFAEWFGRTTLREGYSYNLVPLKEIRRFIEWGTSSETGFKAMVLNVFGNIACFMPFGFFAPINIKKLNNFAAVTVLTFMFSFCIEALQLVSRTGSFDVDDLILNTIGGALGYIGLKVIRSILAKKKRGN